MEKERQRERENKQARDREKEKTREACFFPFSSQQCSRREQADRELL